MPHIRALVICLAVVLFATPSFAGLPGDFNSDGMLDCLDADLLVEAIVSGANDPFFDLTGDGFVDNEDMIAWLATAGSFNLPSGNPYLLGDANLDAFVDGLDFLIWNANKFSETAAWCSGDFTADGTIDGEDFIEFNRFKFMSALSAGGTVEAGWSGGPGDGIPDLYYYQGTATAPNGEMRDAGTLSLDTDGCDFVALLVSSPDLTGDCVVCDGSVLENPNQPFPNNMHTFTHGFINGSTQWIRTLPLVSDGPIGIFDMAVSPGLEGADFPPLFDGDQWSVTLAKDDGGVIYTNVTVVGAPIPVEATSWGKIKSTYR